MYDAFDKLPPLHPRRDPEYACALTSRELRRVFARCGDFRIRPIEPGLEGGGRVCLAWLEGLVSGEAAAEELLRPLTERRRTGGLSDERLFERLLRGGVCALPAQARDTMDALVTDLTHGCCALLFDDLRRALCFELRGGARRNVAEPTLEKSLKGAKDSFVEALRVNTALVRQRLATPQLKLLESSLGRKSSTQVGLLYLEGVADPAKVEALAGRLDTLDVDALLATGIVEETISDAPRSPFPQVLHTERPDRFAMYLADGRVGLLIDGLPIGLVVPVTLAEFMRVTGERSSSFLISSVLSVLRWFALLLGLLLPALYVAMAMYHQEMIPARLLLSMIAAKQNVPFSTALEVLGMLLAFTMLQEAGLRLPNPIGDTVSIIGALIVGQSAVEAQVVSPIAIIVVAVSGISCYTLPSQDLASAVRLCSFLALLSAAAAGLYGVGLFCCLLLLHLAGIDSFGVSYTAPLSEGAALALPRLLLRRPLRRDKLRDPFLNTPDRRRQA